MTVIVDLIGDWVKLMSRELDQAGLPTASLQANEEVSLAYWNYRLRLITDVPRKVHLAREFVCPPQHQAVLDDLKRKVERGEDINRHRSRAAYDPEQKAFNDRLFNDWGVQHFHLGPENHNDVVTHRTGRCLYAYLTTVDAYFLDVMPHNQYEKKELMLRMHRNWPDVIAEHRAPGVVVTEEDDLSDDDANIKTLRGGGFTYLLTLDGVPYITPGGGYMTSGHSFLACRRSDRAFNQLHEWQERIEREAEDIIRQLDAEGYKPADPPKFELGIRNDWYCSAYERTARTKIDMGYLLGAPPS